MYFFVHFLTDIETKIGHNVLENKVLKFKVWKNVNDKSCSSRYYQLKIIFRDLNSC